MKIALVLLFVLTTALGFPNAVMWQPTAYDTQEKSNAYHICLDNCPPEEKEHKWVCTDDGLEGIRSRCDFSCSNKIYHEHKREEVECKPGGLPYCEDFQCTPEEKVFFRNASGWCDNGTPGEYFHTVCNLKCREDGNYRKDAKYELCERPGGPNGQPIFI